MGEGLSANVAVITVCVCILVCVTVGLCVVCVGIVEWRCGVEEACVSRPGEGRNAIARSHHIRFPRTRSEMRPDRSAARLLSLGLPERRTSISQCRGAGSRCAADRDYRVFQLENQS